MREKEQELKKWVKEHKNELIVCGVSIATIILGIFAYKSRKSKLINCCKNLKNNIDKKDIILPSNIDLITNKVTPETTYEVIQDVNSHIRNLPNGWNASAEKVATAAENGYSLQPGQTWVNAYTKCRMIV